MGEPCSARGRGHPARLAIVIGLSLGLKQIPPPTGLRLHPAHLRALIPSEQLRFIKDRRDYFETVRHIFVHACYEPD
jgi:hypothetical protein